MAAAVWVPAVAPGVAAPASCRLSVAYAGTTSGTGDVFAYFLIRNLGRNACRLRHYPLVTLIGPHGRPLTAHQSRTNWFAPDRPVRTLAAGARGHFLVIFMPLTPSGGQRCAPAAATARVDLIATGLSSARAVLPTQLAKEREPINPCPDATFLVSRVAPGQLPAATPP